jgi:hypothetical protein
MSILRTNKKWIMFLCVYFLIGGTSLAQDTKLTNFAIIRYNNDLLFKMNLEGAFNEDMNRAIMTGVPTTFSFYVKLYDIKDMWFKSKIADIYLTTSVKYDSLKKNFTVLRSWKNTEPAITESLKEAQELMTKVDSLKIIDVSRLEKNGKYQIHAKAEVSKLTLPFYLHYIFPLGYFWDLETDWYMIDFVY